MNRKTLIIILVAAVVLIAALIGGKKAGWFGLGYIWVGHKPVLQKKSIKNGKVAAFVDTSKYFLYGFLLEAALGSRYLSKQKFSIRYYSLNIDLRRL